MPLVGFRCDVKGEHPFDECINEGCKCAPPFVLASIRENARTDYHKGGILTATTLTGCPRETFLTRTQPYYANPRSLYYSWRGTLIHSILEQRDIPNWIAERVYRRKVNGVWLYGKIDGYDEKHKTLYDIKTIGDNGLTYVIKNGCKEDHILQTNIYKWIGNGDDTEVCTDEAKDIWEPAKLEIDRIVIVYFSMMECVETGRANWIEQAYKNPPDQKRLGFVEAFPTGKFGKGGYEKYALQYDTPEVKFLPVVDVEEFIEERMALMHNAFEKDEVPGCPKEIHDWKCNDRYCSVYKDCENLGGCDDSE